MSSAALRAFLISTALACAGCTTMAAPAPSAPEGAPAVDAAPSPRPECATAHVTLYFTDQVQSDEPVAMPLLQDLMNRVHACETAGGELRGITIATSADPGQSQREGAEQVRRRQERVTNALVSLGAPADKIHDRVERPDAVMGRRAEITADLY
jgi:hypothetical protein